MSFSESGATLGFYYRINTQSTFSHSGVSDIVNVTFEPNKDVVLMLKLTEERHVAYRATDFVIELYGLYEGKFCPFPYTKEHSFLKKDHELLIHIEVIGPMVLNPHFKGFSGEIDIIVALNNYKPENSISVAFSDDISS